MLIVITLSNDNTLPRVWVAFFYMYMEQSIVLCVTS